jgi:subtilisin family serine protease
MFAKSGRALPCLAAAVAVALLGAGLVVAPAGGAPAQHVDRFGRGQLRAQLRQIAAQHKVESRTTAAARAALPAGVPSTGRYAFLLQLDEHSTLQTYAGLAPRSRSAARAAATDQYARVRQAQREVIANLPADAHVLYRTHAAIAAVAVTSDVHDYATLTGLSGVKAVYPITPKTVSNSYAVPLQKAPQAWTATGDTGANSTIAIIDTGIDYTHANFGGTGTVAAYDAAKASDSQQAAPAYPSKIIGGHDFVGDSYNPDPFLDDGSLNPDYQPTAHPDADPLDCNGHGSHVAGTAAGLGVKSDGTTYTGVYDNTTDFAALRIGPGMAPGAKLYAYKVFGCQGATDFIAAAIDRAADPNNDGNPADHADVINMSIGSDFGSPQDGDSVAANLAAQHGVEVVAASGNGGDYYDVGGSPGNAQRVLAVANSVDAEDYYDALTVSAPAGIAGNYRAERSVDYDWVHDADLSGDVVQLTQTGNTDACDPVTQTVTGKVVFVEWTDNDATRRCGSAARAANLVAAGATGFIFADDENTFAADISGSATIPGVLVTKDAGDAIRTALGTGVHVTGTSVAAFKPVTTANNDKVNDSSSRGVRGNGNVKPDVSAVGTSVFSTAMGTGSQGVSFTGTSMASPMVAGLAALVRSVHQSWTPEEVKADIMNTAGQDLFAGANHAGREYAPNRVGAGRIDAQAALGNSVLAFVENNPGAVSVSFGPVAVTGPTALSKTVKVENKGTVTATYSLAYQSVTSVPGVTYQVSPGTLSIGAGASGKFTVTLKVTNPALLSKTHDATVSSTGTFPASTSPTDLPAELLADASGRVVLSPTGATAGPGLRVPVYSAPRPASRMSTSSSVALSSAAVSSATLKFTGARVNQGGGAAHVLSLAAGLELQATSGKLPNCTSRVRVGCVHFGDERAADLKYVGTTSDSPQVRSLGGIPSHVGFSYFAVAVQGAWRDPSPQTEYDVLIDSNGDNKPDAVLFDTRLDGVQNVFMSVLENIRTGAIIDAEPINDRFGDVDSALYDSNVMLLPVATGALLSLPGSSTRLHYGVISWSDEEPGVVDRIGVRLDADRLPTTLSSSRLSFDPARPGIAVYDPAFTPSNTTWNLFGFPELTVLPDHPTSAVKVRRDRAAYLADRGRGALIIHFHNAGAAKAAAVTLKTRAMVRVHLSTSTVASGAVISATITVANTIGHTPAGRVALHRSSGAVFKSGRLSHGRITFSWRPGAAGKFAVYATYSGDSTYTSGRSPNVSYRVT